MRRLTKAELDVLNSLNSGDWNLVIEFGSSNLKHVQGFTQRGVPYKGLLELGLIIETDITVKHVTVQYDITVLGRDVLNPKPKIEPKTTKEQLKESIDELFRKLYHSDDCEGECEHDKLLLKVKELAAKL